VPSSPAGARARPIELLTDPPPEPDGTGVVDLLGEAAQAGPSTGVAQRLMRTAALPVVYERYWRPALGRVAKGIRGPSMAGEVRLARDLLRLRNGHTVLDVACGTGRFTRAFGDAVGPAGLSVGLDGSRTMLATAARAGGVSAAHVRRRGHHPIWTVYYGRCVPLRGVAHVRRPGRRARLVRVRAQAGGRVALLTSARHGWEPARTVDTLVRVASGQRMFDRGEIGAKPRVRGFTGLTQTYAGVTQIVDGTRR
jgi:SAM-dependent methyltransferase